MHAPMRLLTCLVLANLVSCGQNPEPVSIVFRAYVGGQPADCSGLSDTAMTDLRFFVHDLYLQRADGTEVPVEIGGSGRWQDAGIALIDLEDASGACLNGTQGTNDRVVTSLPPGEYRGLRFVVGVPFERNHLDPLQANAPLDDSTMHWHWRSGYKFFRAGLRDGERVLAIHLGSAGCKGTLQNISGCEFPNRFVVTLTDWHPGDDISVDLAEFLRHVPSDAEDYSCLSAPHDETCRRVFAAFGIDPDSGKQQSEQVVFSLR